MVERLIDHRSSFALAYPMIRQQCRYRSQYLKAGPR